LQSSQQYPSYCGIKGKKYPDAKQMGYPFDRLPPSSKDKTLQEFLTPNMASADVLIYHKSEFYNPSDNTMKKGYNFGSYPEDNKKQIKQLRSGGFSSIPEKIQHPLLTIGGVKYFYSYSRTDHFDMTVSIRC
jgi:Hemocyanin, ig-like domain